MGNRQPALILNTKTWAKITNRQFDDTHVVLKKCKDLKWCKNGPVFKGATHLYLIDCQVDFVFFWVDAITFPNVKHVYMASKRVSFHLRSAFPEATLYAEDTFNSYHDIKPCNRRDFPRFKQMFKS